MKFRVTIESDEDGVFVAECPALPGCISQGKTRHEAMANIRDAIQGYVESLNKHSEPAIEAIARQIIRTHRRSFSRISMTIDGAIHIFRHARNEISSNS